MTRHYRTQRHVRAHLRNGRRLLRAWAWPLPSLWQRVPAWGRHNARVRP